MYWPSVAKAIAVYDAVSNCLTVANKHKSYYLFLSQHCNKIGQLYFFMLHIIFRYNNRGSNWMSACFCLLLPSKSITDDHLLFCAPLTCPWAVTKWVPLSHSYLRQANMFYLPMCHTCVQCGGRSVTQSKCIAAWGRGQREYRGNRPAVKRDPDCVQTYTMTHYVLM